MRSASFARPTSDARFLYELAEHLHKTVGELADMDPAELTGWRAYLAQRELERNPPPPAHPWDTRGGDLG